MSTQAIPVQSKERIQVVDVLRGFAIFGILLFNMRSFAGQSMNPNSWTEPLDRGIVMFIDFFVQAKFYSLFSFLFGWGMAVQMRRAEAKGTKFFPVYLRRLLILLVFGTLHGVLLWTGDILRMYAIIGIIMLLIFRKASPKTLLIAAGLLLLSGIQMTLPGELMNNTREWCGSIAECLSPDRTLSGTLYATGTYWEVTQLRWQEFVGALWWLPCYVGNVLAMMLLGLYTGKRRLFENFDQHRTLFLNVMWVGLVVGIALNGVFTYYTANPFQSKYYSLVRIGARTLGAPAMTLFYITAITLLFQKEKWHERLAPLANVGRMALSNYITHSVVLTFFFYGYGLGLYGETDPTFAALLTIVVYLAQIRFSQSYFERYQFGPLEWGWRKLSYGRVRLASDKKERTPAEIQKRRVRTFGIVWVFLLFWGFMLVRWSRDLSAERAESPLEQALRGTPVPEAALVSEADAQQEYTVVSPVTQPVDRTPGEAAAIGDLSAIANAFDVDAALAYIEELTKSKYDGRVAGSEGGQLAAEYIADQFEKYGLQPAGVDGTFYQDFPVTYTALDGSSTLELTFPNGDTEEIKISQTQTLVGGYIGTGSGSGEIVWGKDCAPDSFLNVDIVGKVLLCQDSDIARVGRTAVENGASGLLVLAQSETSFAADTALFPVWIPEPIPALRISTDAVEKILRVSDFSLAELSLVYEPVLLPVQANLAVNQQKICTDCTGQNVLGVLPGRDAIFTDDIVIVGASYDGLSSDWGGATPSASGIAIMIEIARSWQEQGYVPNSTILFAAWDAGYQDDLGAEFYAQFPQYEPEDIVAVIQLDPFSENADEILISGGGNVAETIRDTAESIGLSASLTDKNYNFPIQGASHLAWQSGGLEFFDNEKLEEVGKLTSLSLLGLADVPADIDILLTRRANALLEDDQIAFLTTSTTDQQTNDRLWFADAQSLAPTDGEMAFENLHVAGDLASANVTITLEIPGDSGGSREISLSMPTQFRYVDGEWLWVGPDLVWQEFPEDDETPRFAVAYPAGKEEGLETLGADAAAKYTEVAEQLGLPTEVDAQILLFDGNEPLRASSAMSLARDENSAITPNTIKLTYSAEIAGGERFNDAIVQLALANAGVPRAAAPWLWDGLPLVLEAVDDPIGVQETTLSPLDNLALNEEPPFTYAMSWAAVDYLREERGWNGLGNFITAFGRACERNDCTTEIGADAALASALRMDTASFNLAWRQHWSTKLTDTQTALDELLAARSDAVLSGDRNAFLATVDSRTPNLIREESAWFDDLSNYPAETFSLSAKPVAILDDGSVHASVTLSYQLEGHTERWASGTSTFRVLFKRSGSSYRWAGVPFDLVAGDRVRVRYPAGQEELANEILAAAQSAYAQLAADMSVSNPAWQTINLYADENAYRTSIFLSYPDNDWSPGWSAEGQSLKLLIEAGKPIENYTTPLVTHLARNLLLQNGVQDEWLLTGGSYYLARGVAGGASQMEAASNLYSLGKAIDNETLFDFAAFPAPWRLSEDEYKIAIPQAWDSVRFLRETYGQDAAPRSLPEFVTAWKESFAVGHSTDNWVAIAERFDDERALAHIDALTAPEMAGRQAGSDGADLAANYIAEKFAEYGLDVQRQSFPVFYQHYLATPTLDFKLQASGIQEVYLYREDFLMLQAVDTDGLLRGDLVWVLDEEYANMDLGGNIVVRKPTKSIAEELALATEHGAGALLLVGDLNRSEALSAKYLAREMPPEGSIPVLELTRDGFKRLLDMTDQSIASIYSTPPALFLGANVTLSIDLNEDTDAVTDNVFGFLPGSDPALADEIILVGAHYDHVGDNPNRQYSGANDDASGVAVMLEMARLWQQTGYRPSRSVLFVAWGGQELGEAGSRYYVEHPLYPLEDVVAMLQLDAVGGGEAYHLDAQGTRENEGLLRFSIEHAKDLLDGRLQLSFPEERGEQPFSPDVLFDRDRIGIRSDHDPFRALGIQAMRIAWREADETNLDDANADEVLPERILAAGKMTVLTIMMNAH